jgi:hypothetical protein
MLRLDPPIPLDTPRGKAWAHILIDRSQEHDLEWVCFINETGESWTFRSKDVRLDKNLTMGIRIHE